MTRFAVLSVLASSLVLSSYASSAVVRVTVNNGTTHALSVRLGDDDFEKAAARFVDDHGLVDGAGCRSDRACVARQLVAALEREAAEAFALRGGEGANEIVAATTLGSGPLFSGCGWHADGYPFSEHTPLADATARSSKRMEPVHAFLERFASNASGALDGLVKVASRRRPGTEEEFDILDVPGGAGGACSGNPAASKVTLAIGIISAPGNLAHRMAIR